MSSQLNSSTDRKKGKLEMPRAVIGAQLPRANLLRPRQFSLIRDGRRGRRRGRLFLAWATRPILGQLVTHRRRFTTGHKHKQPFRG